MWGKKSKQRIADDPEALRSSVATTSVPTAARIRRMSNTKKLLLILLVACIVAGGLWYYFDMQARNQRSTTLPTEKVYFQSELDRLIANPPKPNATLEERADYYQKLSFTYADVGQYQEAVSAFENRAALPVAGLKYFHYLNLARYHHELGDSDQASSALNRAEEMLRSGTENNDIYSLDEELQNIEKLRKEYAK